jgi:hypothetical protein
VAAAVARGDGEEDSRMGNARVLELWQGLRKGGRLLAGSGYLWTVEFGERATMANGRLGAHPRGGRGGLNRARARPAVTAGDDSQDVAVLRHSSAGTRTAGPRTDRRSAVCTTHVRHGNGEIEASRARLQPREGAWA